MTVAALGVFVFRVIVGELGRPCQPTRMTRRARAARMVRRNRRNARGTRSFARFGLLMTDGALTVCKVLVFMILRRLRDGGRAVIVTT